MSELQRPSLRSLPRGDEAYQIRRKQTLEYLKLQRSQQPLTQSAQHELQTKLKLHGRKQFRTQLVNQRRKTSAGTKCSS